MILATRAVLAAGIERPQVLYWTLHASLVSRPEQHDIFGPIVIETAPEATT